MENTIGFVIIIGMLLLGILPMVVLLIVNINDSIETNKRLTQIRKEIREIIDNM